MREKGGMISEVVYLNISNPAVEEIHGRMPDRLSELSPTHEGRSARPDAVPSSEDVYKAKGTSARVRASLKGRRG